MSQAPKPRSCVNFAFATTQPIVNAVRMHHRPGDTEGQTLEQLTAMAEFMVYPQQVGYADIPGIPPKRFGWLQQRTGLAGPIMKKVKDSIGPKLEEALEIFKMDEADRKAAPTYSRAHRVE